MDINKSNGTEPQNTPPAEHAPQPRKAVEPAIFEEEHEPVNISLMYSETETRTVATHEEKKQEKAPDPTPDPTASVELPTHTKAELESFDVDGDLLRKVNKDVSRTKKREVFALVLKHILSAVFIMLFSVAVASVFWIYVLNIDDNAHEKTFIVDVKILNADSVLAGKEREGSAGYKLYIDDTVTATVTLKGRRAEIYDITNYNLDEYLEFYIDAAKVTDMGVNILEIESSAKSNDVLLEVVDIYPKTVTVLADTEVTKELEIKNNISYILDSPLYEEYTDAIELSLDRLSVTGPGTVLAEIVNARVFLDLGSVSQSRNINGVPIEYVDSHMSPISNEYIRYIECEHSTVNVRLMIRTTRQIPVTVKCGANAQNFVASTDGQYITVTGDPIVLNSIGGVIELNSAVVFEFPIKEPTTLTFGVGAISLPEGVELSADSPQEIKVTFAYPDNPSDATVESENNE
ncbi:MAG: hypothetical protein IKA82_04220 [Clostridia bacterium]|nr:hypothetical protein [Clostridia bacterium]